jgi:ATP-binding cassette subfamily A (ABC1) protein 3
MTYVLAFGGHHNITNYEEFKDKLVELLPPMVQMQRFPYASWIEDPLLQALESFVGIIIMLSFVYTCINTVKVITTEKEKQLKEAMKIMGLPNWLHWTAWFLKTFVFLLISIVLIIVLLKVSWYPHTEYSVFTYADPTVMLVFLLLYICATITFCFAISVFFSKANTAATVAGLLWFLSYAPYLFLQQQYDQLSLSTKLFASLGSNTAMAYGFQLMLMFEGTSEGIQWSNVGRPNTPDDSLTLGLIMMMLVIDTFIYLMVAIYVEAVFPGEYGVPLPWYFPFTSSYWFGHPRYIGVEDFSDSPTNEGEFFEKDPNLSAGIQIRNLRKVFGTKAAVRNLSLNMYNDQITVLLGHNGAGKTTTMSMLTGMFPPTSGTAIVSGHDIRTDMDGVRASLGLCPQHNILFDDLTVNEHLYFFSKLKGLKKEAIDEEIEKYIELLELQPKANARAATLSGGMKRKLCVGMALCGDSKVVMLDEPTAGMDPSARRALWDLLQRQKQGRTMLLTTHFMDEADLLGDRIAIMAGGELQCCGSSFFLKKKYGAGYHLVMDKSPASEPEKITNLLRKHIPNIQVHGNVGSELTYLLVENQSSVFEEMLQDLEQESEALGIRSYGISLTTLEEVFMKVGADHGQEETYNGEVIQENGLGKNIMARIKSKFGLHEKFETNPQETRLTLENPVLLTGFALVKNQFLAMLMKRVLSIIRTWILQFIQILMPVAFLVIAIIVSRNTNKSQDLPKLSLTLDSYNDPVTLMQGDPNNDYFKSYAKTLQGHDVQNAQNITEIMLNLTETVPATVRMRYIVGASFEERYAGLFTMITAWFNNNPYHSPPLALGLVLNVVYKKLVSENSNIRFANYPLPFTADTKVQQLLQGNSMGFQLAFNIGFSMAFVSSFYVLFYVKERVCKSKHLQFVSGVKVYIFWIMAFICDLVTFIVTIIAIIITLVCFQEDGFNTSEDLGTRHRLRSFFYLTLPRFSSYVPLVVLFWRRHAADDVLLFVLIRSTFNWIHQNDAIQRFHRRGGFPCGASVGHSWSRFRVRRRHPPLGIPASAALLFSHGHQRHLYHICHHQNVQVLRRHLRGEQTQHDN